MEWGRGGGKRQSGGGADTVLISRVLKTCHLDDGSEVTSTGGKSGIPASVVCPFTWSRMEGNSYHLMYLLFFDASSHLYKGVCPSARWSVRHKRVEFLRNGLNLNKTASGT